jgi:hypothetical protein
MHVPKFVAPPSRPLSLGRYQSLRENFGLAHATGYTESQ